MRPTMAGSMGGDGSIQITSAAHRDLHTLDYPAVNKSQPVILIISLIVRESSLWRFMLVGVKYVLTFKWRLQSTELLAAFV